MSDFSTVELALDFPSIPTGAQVPQDRSYQTKDLPDDDELTCCVDGEIEADGRLVRTDNRGRFWCPDFNWWVRLVPQFGGDELYVRFSAGIAIEVQLDDSGYRDQRPDGVECAWVRIDVV